MARFVINKTIEDEFKGSIECVENNWSLYTEKLLLDVRETIAQQMNKKNINRADLAKSLNCSRSYISQLLNGDVNIRLGTLVKVLLSLGVKPTLNYTYPERKALQTFKINTTTKIGFTTTPMVEHAINQQEYEQD